MVHLTLISECQGHTDRAWSLAWSPDGQCLASCSGDKTVRLWAQKRLDASQPATAVDGLRVQPGQQPASGASSSAIPQQQSDSQNSWHCIAILEDAHTRTIRGVAWSPDGRCLAMASFDATTSIWSRVGQGWEQVAVLEGHENEVKCVAWSPDGVHIATCGRDKTVWIWESLPGHEYECVDVKQGHQQDVKMVAWHPGGEQLVSCSYDDTIKTWASDGDEWVCTQTLAGSASGGMGHDSTVWAVSLNASGDGMVSCSDDLSMKFWTAQPGPGSETQPRRPTRPHWRHAATVSGYHHRPIFSVDWQKCGQQLVATGDGDNSIKVFAPSDVSDSAMAVDGAGAGVATSWQQVACLEGAHEADVNCVRWHPTEPGLLASCGDDNVVRIWKVTGFGGGDSAGMDV